MSLATSVPDSTIPHPSVPQALVTTPAALVAVCEHLREERLFAFDTEFIGENTYLPVLCLVQVATRKQVELIDPMALGRAAMRPFWELLADETLEKICHAGDQDVEIAWLESGLVTRNMFDTQIGAGMLGITYPTALWRAVEHFTGIPLEKAHTYSAWNRRPLSREQFAYAIDDVRYLPAVHAAMRARLEALGHAGWMRMACDEMCAECAGPGDARKLFLRLRGASGLSSQQLSVLREVTSLREQIAYEHDLPARAFLKDEVLMDIGQRMPRSLADLARIRDMPPAEVETYGETILGLVKKGAELPERDRPNMFAPGEDSAEEKRQGETLWVATQAICLGQSVNPSLVTSQSEIMALARLVHDGKPYDKHPLMHGWHKECLGDKLAAFIRGELQVDLTLRDMELNAAFHAK